MHLFIPTYLYDGLCDMIVFIIIFLFFMNTYMLNHILYFFILSTIFIISYYSPHCTIVYNHYFIIILFYDISVRLIFLMIYFPKLNIVVLLLNYYVFSFSTFIQLLVDKNENYDIFLYKDCDLICSIFLF